MKAKITFSLHYLQEKSGAQEKINLDDFIEQIKSMNSLGGFGKLKELIPGFSGMKTKIPENALENQSAKISKWEHIIKSMTQHEKENPEILEKETSRISRIAKGSGANSSDVRALLKQYKMINEMVKSGMASDFSSGAELNPKQMQKLARKFMKGGKLKF